MAWGLTTFSDLGWTVFENAVLFSEPGEPSRPFEWEQASQFVTLYAFFGLPPAVLVSFAFGARAFDWAWTRRLVRLRDAARVGAAVGAIVGGSSLLVTVLGQLGDAHAGTWMG